MRGVPVVCWVSCAVGAHWPPATKREHRELTGHCGVATLSCTLRILRMLLLMLTRKGGTLACAVDFPALRAWVHISARWCAGEGVSSVRHAAKQQWRGWGGEKGSEEGGVWCGVKSLGFYVGLSFVWRNFSLYY